jgi:hypothetical protein
MRPNAITLAVALALAAGSAMAQGTSTGSVPSGRTAGGSAVGEGPATSGPANSGGVIPTAPPVKQPNAPALPTDNTAGQPGVLATTPPEAVVVPPFPPSTPGVTPIDSPTKATVGSSPSDREMRDSVAAALAADPGLHGAQINVLVSGGAVTLSGTALNPEQVKRAREVAARVAGSSRVTESIKPAA